MMSKPLPQAQGISRLSKPGALGALNSPSSFAQLWLSPVLGRGPQGSGGGLIDAHP